MERQGTRGASKAELPVLVPFAGRTESHVRKSLDLEEASAHAQNPDYVSLLHRAFRKRIPGLPYRGYSLVRPEKQADEATTFRTCS